MQKIPVTKLGSLVILHVDNPSASEIRERICDLLDGAVDLLPRSGIVEAWTGESPDECIWRIVSDFTAADPKSSD